MSRALNGLISGASNISSICWMSSMMRSISMRHQYIEGSFVCRVPHPILFLIFSRRFHAVRAALCLGCGTRSQGSDTKIKTIIRNRVSHPPILPAPMAERIFVEARFYFGVANSFLQLRRPVLNQDQRLGRRTVACLGYKETLAVAADVINGSGYDRRFDCHQGVRVSDLQTRSVLF